MSKILITIGIIFRPQNPFLLLRLPSESCAHKIMGRTMLGRFMIEVWGHGNSWSELYESLNKVPEQNKAPYNLPETSFCFKMRTLGKKLGMEEKLATIEGLAECLDFKAKVDLRNPEHVFHVYADYGLVPNQGPKEPYKVYFGRLVSITDKFVWSFVDFTFYRLKGKEHI